MWLILFVACHGVNRRLLKMVCFSLDFFLVSVAILLYLAANAAQIERCFEPVIVDGRFGKHAFGKRDLTGAVKSPAPDANVN